MSTADDRRTFVAERWLLAVYCWATAAYAFMSANPFIYRGFLLPRAFRWLMLFSDWHAAVYWAWLSVALVHIGGVVRRRGPARVLAAGFAVVWTIVGLVVSASPLLPKLVDDQRSVIVGLIALVPILWLAAIDHVRRGEFLTRVDGVANVSSSDDGRLFAAAIGSAGFVTIVYAVLTPLATAGQFEPDLLTSGLAVGFLWNLLDHLLIFCTVFLVLAIVDRVLLGARFVVRYAASVALVIAIISLITGRAISDPLGFNGGRSAIVSLAVAVSIAALWSSLGLKRWVDARPSSPF